MKQNRESELWLQLVESGLRYDDGPSNCQLSFQQMSKRYGKAWIDYLKAAWIAKPDNMTDREFADIHGGIPENFLNKLAQ